MKIIQILHHSLSALYSGVDARSYKEDWHVKIAKQIRKRTTKYEIECWRPERTLKEVYTQEEDGITYRIFPSFYLKFGMEYSLPLIMELRKESKKEDILINLNGFHNHLDYQISYLFRDVPIVASHRGGSPYTYRYHNFRYLKLYYFPLYMLEPYILGCMDEIITGSRDEYEFLSQIHTNITFSHPDGVDFEKFKHINDVDARKMLNIPANKKIMLYVGRFYTPKGVDVILDTYKKLKDRYDVELFLIGGQKTDPLYHKAVKEGAIVIERMPHDALIRYYNAADVYLLPLFKDPIIKFGALGTAQIEALACGTPIVATNLRHFMGDWRKVGKIPKTPEDVAKCTSEIFDEPAIYSNCREITKKYYTWDVVLRHYINSYDTLCEKYYG
jgi:glycosyltransferase involved in cell wall biosynthesis